MLYQLSNRLGHFAGTNLNRDPLDGGRGVATLDENLDVGSARVDEGLLHCIYLNPAAKVREPISCVQHGKVTGEC